MDSAQLLDILGNENRRKILQLLSNRPYYVSEISGRLGVGPKAIISHLGLLERTGLVKCHVDDHRRKYFNIVDNMRLVVSVSPHSYAVSIHAVPINTGSRGLRAHCEETAGTAKARASMLMELNREIQELIAKQEELARMQQELQAEFTELMEVCIDSIKEVADSPVEAEILYTLFKNEQTAASLSYGLALHPNLVAEELLKLAEKRLIEYTIRNNQQYWKIRKIRETGDDR